MKGKQACTFLCYAFSGVFVLIIGLLTILAIFLHCELNINTYAQIKSITTHTPYLYCALAVFGMGAVAVFCIIFQHLFLTAQKAETAAKVICYFCGFVILAAGIFWICFNDGVPVYDQATVYAEARRLAGFLDEPFDIEYFSYFHRNRGITLLVAGAYKLFGNHFYSFPIFNLIASLIAYGSICKATKILYRNPIVSSITSILLMLFYPLVIYTSYYYGTLLSVAFASLGLYAAMALRETGNIKYGILMIFAFPIGIIMHQSAAIALIAVIIYLSINTEKKVLVKHIVISACTIIVLSLSLRAVDSTYVRLTGADPNVSAVPVTATIYMGLTSDEEAGGPGSQDGSFTRLFEENNCDADATNRDAIHRIITVLQEYATGKRDPRFFLTKVEYQWLDPTIGARKIIRLNDLNMGEPPNSEAFTSFYYSSFRNIIFKLSIGAMLLTYAGALIAGVKTIRNIKTYYASVLIQLYIIGGFAFQLFWESLSRYCFGYFIWLIPQAAFGICSLYRFARPWRK